MQRFDKGGIRWSVGQTHWVKVDGNAMKISCKSGKWESAPLAN